MSNQIQWSSHKHQQIRDNARFLRNEAQLCDEMIARRLGISLENLEQIEARGRRSSAEPDPTEVA